MSIRLSITNQSPAAIDTRWLARQLRRLLKLQKISAGSWSITIVNDKEMKALHKKTMNDPTTTDVLTFDLRDLSPSRTPDPGPRTPPLDLDTVLCHSVAARRAKELGHSVQHELLLYALHSLLHVQGYDDITTQQAARMHRREDALLIRLGLGSIYAPQNRTRSALAVAVAATFSALQNGTRSVSEGVRPQNRKSKLQNRK